MKPPPPSSMKPPPPSSSSSVGVITATKNDAKDEMLDTKISMEALDEMKEKEIIESDNEPKNITTANIYNTKEKKPKVNNK